jgi:hypothetical protein
MESVANIAKGKDCDARSDYRDATDPKESQQQTACHAEPKRYPCPHFRAAGHR